MLLINFVDKFQTMKQFALILTLLITSFSFAKDIDLRVNWSFLEVQEDVDYSSKVQITIDGKLVHESHEFKETDNNAFTVCKVKAGKHKVNVQVYTLYNNVWEAKTKSNEYSVDAFYSGEVTFKKDAELTLVFDIGLEKTTFYWVGIVNKKEKMCSTSITWQYLNVEQGYDHDSKLHIEIDGQLVHVSSVIPESQLGKVEVEVPQGVHTISIKSYTMYKGRWQAHTIENGYSVDALYSQQLEFKGKSKKIDLKFDFDSGAIKPTIE